MVTISPSFSLYRMVVFPAASSPTIRILISFFPIRLFNKLPKMFPMTVSVALKICTHTGPAGTEGWRSVEKHEPHFMLL